jgi:hypothetical protein
MLKIFKIAAKFSKPFLGLILICLLVIDCGNLNQLNNDLVIMLVNQNKSSAVDSISITYKTKEDIKLVTKKFYVNGVTKSFSYYLKIENSVAKIGKEKIIDGEITSEIEYVKYLTIKDSSEVKFSCGIHPQLNGSMQFIGTENTIVYGNPIILYKFSGQDIGIKSYTNNYYFFDSAFHLLKIIMSDDTLEVSR